jgi:hypothetical protein
MEKLEKDGWVSIFKSADSIDVNLKKSKLEAAGINSVTFDHQDSMLTSLNDTKLMVSLFVHKNDVDKAREVIENI